MLYDFSKRMLDIVGSLLGLIILAPIFLIIAISIKIDSSGPVFADIPKRVGQKGKLFRMYKFRSMVEGAQEILNSNPELLKKYKQMKKMMGKIQEKILSNIKTLAEK